MFTFSLEAEVGGYWSHYLNREKFFFFSRQRRRRKKEGGRRTWWWRRRAGHDLLTLSGTCGYESNTFPQLILTHYSSPLSLCNSVHWFPVRWVQQGKIHLGTHTHTHFYFSIKRTHASTSLIFIPLPPLACTCLSPSSKTGLHPVKTNIKQIINHTKLLWPGSSTTCFW